MKYQITITKIEEKTVTKKGHWTTVEKRPWTQKELDDEQMSSMYRSQDQFLEKNPLKEVQGYAPDIVTIQEDRTEILTQTVETLDLAAVIKAVNGL